MLLQLDSLNTVSYSVIDFNIHFPEDPPSSVYCCPLFGDGNSPDNTCFDEDIQWTWYKHNEFKNGMPKDANRIKGPIECLAATPHTRKRKTSEKRSWEDRNYPLYNQFCSSCTIISPLHGQAQMYPSHFPSSKYYLCTVESNGILDLNSNSLTRNFEYFFHSFLRFVIMSAGQPVESALSLEQLNQLKQQLEEVGTGEIFSSADSIIRRSTKCWPARSSSSKWLPRAIINSRRTWR